MQSHELLDNYTTGLDQRLTNIHTETSECQRYGCAIHNPTDPRRDLPTYWTGYALGLVRVDLDTGNLYADADEINWRLRQEQNIFELKYAARTHYAGP